jgi:sucrose-phosphate synthase
VDAAYGQPEERLVQGRGELGGAYIVRLPCGPTNTYVRKELLWPYVREFADRGIAHANATLAAITAQGKRCELYAVHGGLRGRRLGQACMQQASNVAWLLVMHMELHTPSP